MAKNPTDAPTLENYPTLAKWLNTVGAERLSRTEIGKLGGVALQALEVWNFHALNGELRQAVILLRARRHGWDIFTPGSSIRTGATLVDAEARLGLMPSIAPCERCASPRWYTPVDVRTIEHAHSTPLWDGSSWPPPINCKVRRSVGWDTAWSWDLDLSGARCFGIVIGAPMINGREYAEVRWMRTSGWCDCYVPRFDPYIAKYLTLQPEHWKPLP